MTINAAGSSAAQNIPPRHSFAQAKQSLDDLASALQSGDLDKAKEAFAQFQAAAPKGRGGDAIGGKIEALGKALESGVVSGAQSALADLKQSAPQRGPGGGRPAGGPPPGGPQGAPPGGGPHRAHGGGGGGRGAEGTSDDASTAQAYEAADTNKDGKISLQELIAYAQSQATKASGDTSDASDETSNSSTEAKPASIDTYA